MTRVAFAVLVAAIASLSSAGPHAQAPAGQVPSDWFDDDEWNLEVRYIITPEELARHRGTAPDFMGAYSEREQKFAFAFSVPPIASCDGTYRICSPAPTATARGAFTSIQVYPRRFVTVSIAVDFSQTASVAHSLEKPGGEPVPFEEAAMLSAGQIGPAGTDPLSRHLLACRMFEPNGMGYTQPLPAGAYVFKSRVVLLGGAVREDRVAFTVQ